MAAKEKTNSRAGSLSIDGGNVENNANSQTHLLHGGQPANGHEDRSSLSELARRNTIRKRSLR